MNETLDPANYIEKVCLATGEVLTDPIEPEQLLVRHHRDYHIVDTYARSLTSWLVRTTKDEDKARQIVRRVRKFGRSAAGVLAKAIGKDPDTVSEKLFGLRNREYYFRFKGHHLDGDEIKRRITELKKEAEDKLKQVDTRVLLTGGTGFVGKEIMYQAAQDPDIKEMVVLIRPKIVKHKVTGEVILHLTPEDRGRELLKELWLDSPEIARRFRFIDGDIEKPRFGISDSDFEMLKKTITHVIHCAASVAFDDPYEASFQANVEGSKNALQFSMDLQNTPGSPFVCHLSVETSYIHGRQTKNMAREDEIVFPRNFYNNYYELTKAMGSLETERFMLEKGLRVTQLCPAIVIGCADTGNNRGDQKVVNAPVNAFGRARKELVDARGDWVRYSKAQVLYRMARVFPGDEVAELNLIPVDWVAQGILAAVKRPQSVGERVHLATDNRISAAKMREILKEELKVEIKFAEPTVHRNLQLPVVTKVLTGLKQKKVARALRKLGTIFGSYGEWGQPVHQVGNDVEVLGMPLPRPNTEAAFRMLCRHNKYVQEFGTIRDLMELSRREKLWTEFLNEVQAEIDYPLWQMPPKEFARRVRDAFDREKFERKDRKALPAAT